MIRLLYESEFGRRPQHSVDELAVVADFHLLENTRHDLLVEVLIDELQL